VSDSPRKVIRQAVVDLLKTPVDGEYPTACEDRIYGSRSVELTTDMLPAICIYTQSADPGETQDLGGAAIEQTVHLLADIHGNAEPPDDQLDDISWQAERTVVDGLNLSGDNPELREVRWEKWSPAKTVSGELIEGVATTTFAIVFIWRKPEAEYELSDFTTIHGTMTPAPDGDQPDEEFRAELEV